MEVPKINDFAYKIKLRSFEFVKSFEPMKYKATNIYDGALASKYAFVAGYVAAQLGKYVVYPLMLEPFMKTIGESSSLEEIATKATFFTAFLTVSNEYLRKDTIEQHKTEHKVELTGNKHTINGTICAGLIESTKVYTLF